MCSIYICLYFGTFSSSGTRINASVHR